MRSRVTAQGAMHRKKAIREAKAKKKEEARKEEKKFKAKMEKLRKATDTKLLEAFASASGTIHSIKILRFLKRHQGDDEKRLRLARRIKRVAKKEILYRMKSVRV